MLVDNNDRQIFLKRKTYPWVAILNRIAAAFIIAGALNWGLVGLYDFNAVEHLFGPWMARLVYMAVGSSGLIYSITKVYYKLNEK